MFYKLQNMTREPLVMCWNLSNMTWMVINTGGSLPNMTFALKGQYPEGGFACPGLADDGALTTPPFEQTRYPV